MNQPEFIAYLKKVNREISTYKYFNPETRKNATIFMKFVQERLLKTSDLNGLPIYAQFLCTLQSVMQTGSLQ
jgi:hypothetical protein